MRSDAKKAAEKKYRQSEKGKVANVRHKQSEKCKATTACYNQSKRRKVSDHHYRQSRKGKTAEARGGARYAQSDKGKITDARVKAKRKRNLDYKPINNWFPKSQGHHIDKENVLFIPEELHRSISHSQDDSASMKLINTAAFEWLCTQEVL